MIMNARRGLTAANSGITVTADTKNDPAYVGTQIVGTRYLAGDGLETFRNYLLKVADNGDRSTAISVVTTGSGIDQRSTTLENIAFTALLRANALSDRNDPTVIADTSTFSPYPARTLLLDAKRGVQNTTEIKTIDGIGNAPYSSVVVTYGSRERDVVGIIDFYNSTFFNGKTFNDPVTIGSDNGFRFQSTQSSETVKFFIDKRFDETPAGGQGINIGPTMLDLTGIADGLNFYWIDRETDTVTNADNSTFSPFPARLMIMSARRGVATTISSITVTADAKNDPVYMGTQIAANRKDVLENTFFTMLKPMDSWSSAANTVTLGSGFDQRQSNLERISFTSLKNANLDDGSNARNETLLAGSGILGIRVAGNSLENMSNIMLLDAKRGLQGTVELKTIDGIGNSPYSSIVVTYGSRERDSVGIVDFYNSTFFNGKSLTDTVTIGSDNGFRFQSLQTSETVKFFINKRFDETPAGGQGINIGPTAIDNAGIFDGLNYLWIDRETDTVSATDASAFSPFPARLAIMSARRGAVTAVSGTTVTADTKNDPVYMGTQITGTRYLAGDGLETLRNYLIKIADNGDRSTAVSAVTMLDPDSLVVLKRAALDSGSYDRFDPVTAGSGILGIRVAGNSLENMNMLMLKSARQGVNNAVSGTTVTGNSGDRLFIGQQYGTRRLSGDPLENIGLITLKTTGIGGGGTSFSTVTSTDTIRPIASYFLNNGSGQTFETAVLDEAKSINNYKPLNETSAVSDGSQVRDVQKSVLGDPNDINIVSSGGSLRNTSYADISYFAEDYVGDSRSIF
jgi:hypothetical protein